ncbi:membrane lipoprotein lipid attachment site-containing protein [Pseudoalteromonas sp. SG41-1]|uniref:membrane lipoprotein lipid attachment site-containing protein n=1 Tax=Pseudoalteromonas sp. SG41-1 TaxID=2760979 RepID=UPI0016012A87|nr:membrane lipoprotein lipid attachment site-containing protein [Pseudoalteromonas sp. SG41-1]MBB1507989.1 membrane lipoprotein lipid attachment site-containing protein [Pseudoalteromonas sp. SG41-1]
MKKILLTSVIALILSGCGEEPQQKQVKITPTEPTAKYVVQIDLDKVVDEEGDKLQLNKDSIKVKKDPRLTPYIDYSDELFKTEDKELKANIVELIEGYEKVIKDITKQFDDFIDEAVNVRKDNIKEINEVIVSQNALMDENCVSIDKTNEVSCAEIMENVHNLKEQVKKIENDILNIKKKLVVEHDNELKKYYTQLKNKVAKAKA